MDQIDDSNWIYNQSGVIPFRREKDGVQIMLITSRRRKRWVIPKGIVEPDLTPQESAEKEAFEEAGISGKISQETIGEYSYDKWGGTCTVKVFLLEVGKIFEDWPESFFRTREWLSLDQAIERVDEQELKDILRSISRYI